MAIRSEADDLIAFLNSLAKIDPVAMGLLCAARVPCSRELADHPTVQVAAGGETGFASDNPAEFSVPAGEFRVGLIGIINGYIGAFDDGPRKGWGAIGAIVEQGGRVSGFRRIENAAATAVR